ncbi:hypothetical protein CH252_32990 [Rhodococcus sp. 06-1477-1B]|nr:hypothetical protein CH252_32990 [Rhodococcus sp. 06-1477-1B]
MSARNPIVENIVNDLIATDPDIPATVDDLTDAQRREVDRLVARSRVTPEAALSVLRGRQQEHRAAAAAEAAAAAIVEAIR